MSRSPRNDPFDMEAGGSSGDNMSGRKPTEKIEKLQAHVAEVSNIMTENINKILDRGQRLDDLEGRSEVLASSADDFRVSSRRVSRKMWWQNMKFNIIIGVVVVSVIIIIIVTVTNK